MQFDWLAAFCPITGDSKLCQICWWDINNNISFHYRLFLKKTWQNFSKNQKKLFWSHSGCFLPKLGPKMKFSWKKGLCQFFNIRIIYHCAKNQKNLMNNSWENCSTDTPESCNWLNNPVILIGQENFGPYLKNQNLSKYQISWSIWQLQYYKLSL